MKSKVGIEVMEVKEEVYKVFVLEANNVLKNLFYGLEGTRTIKFDTWLKAEKEIVCRWFWTKTLFNWNSCVTRKRSSNKIS